MPVFLPTHTSVGWFRMFQKVTTYPEDVQPNVSMECINPIKLNIYFKYINILVPLFKRFLLRWILILILLKAYVLHYIYRDM